MNIKDMECFICAYEQKSFSKAAARLYVTPQGISKTIKRMENELGAELFIRNTSGGIHPTEAGEYFYHHISDLVNEYHKIEEGVRSITAQSSGILRLVSAFGILRFLTPEFINQFKTANPDIHLDYMEYPDRYIKQNVLDGTYDIGMTPYQDSDQDPAFNTIPLFEREVFLIAGPQSRFYDRKEVSLQEIFQEPLLIENQNFLIHQIFKDACEKCHAKYRIYFETSGFSLCYKLCKQGKGNTVSMDFIFEDMADPTLRKIPFSEHLQWKVGLILRKDIPVSNPVSQFVKFAEKWCGV